MSETERVIKKKLMPELTHPPSFISVNHDAFLFE